MYSKMDLRGRKTHNYYSSLGFVCTKVDSGRTAAKCMVCNLLLKNTAIARLRTHRKRCHPITSSASADSDCEEETTSQRNDGVVLLSDVGNNDQNENMTDDELMTTVNSFNEAEEVNVREEVLFLDVNEACSPNSQSFRIVSQEDLFSEDSMPTPSGSDIYITDQLYSSTRSTPTPLKGRTNTQNCIKSKLTVKNVFSQTSSVMTGFGSNSSVTTSKSSTPRKTTTSILEPDLQLQDDTENLNNKKKKRSSNNSKLTAGFVDIMDKKSKKAIDIALAKFFFGCNIPFVVVESDHFKNLLHLLCPSYSLPTRKTVSTVLLDQVNEELMDTNKKFLEKDTTLLIDGWKNSWNNTQNVVTMLQSVGGESLFLESYDFSIIRKTGEALADVCEKSINVAKTKYNCDVYAVVSDNAANMCKMGRLSDLWHSTCSSHTGNLLAKDIINLQIMQKVTVILKEFKLTALENWLVQNGGSRIILPDETHWCSHRDACESLLKNLPIMKTIVAQGKVKLKPEVTYNLYDDDFIRDVKQTISVLNPVCELINKSQGTQFSIADATEEWINLRKSMQNCEETLKNAVDDRLNMAINVYSLSANFLHPVYRGQQLDYDQRHSVQDFLLENLDAQALNGLHLFKKDQDIFKQLLDKKITSVDTYWGLVEHKFPTFAVLAQKLLKIPASSGRLERVFSNWSYVHSTLRNRLTTEKFTKLIFVYYSLKLRDTNKSDQY